MRRERSALKIAEEEAYQAELLMAEGDDEDWVVLEEDDAPEEAFVFNEDDKIAEEGAAAEALQESAAVEPRKTFHRESWRPEPTLCDICSREVSSSLLALHFSSWSGSTVHVFRQLTNAGTRHF